ncbi:MAG TPA: ATP-binding protein [Caulobacteraceae bacterium]|jgi:two-component system cell cycle sensor histidine kinase/response regulator CckA|nr:ATP-binding protein [Caulobacteraceae bacterium]
MTAPAPPKDPVAPDGDSRGLFIAPLGARERPPKAKRRDIDPLTPFAAVLFVLAIAGAAYPAFKAGPTTGPGLLLLFGLAGVSFLGLFAFGTTELRETAAVSSDEGLAGLVDALQEPAAVAGADGRLSCANAPWRALMGEARRLPKGPTGGLYAALAAARRVGAGEARLTVAGEERGVAVSRLAGDRLLVRLPVSRSLEVVRLLADGNAPIAAPPASAAEPPSSLEAFAGAAPFGAALLDGTDPFEAAIVQANAALGELTEGAALPGAPFGALIDPSSRTEARARLATRPGGPVEVRLALDALRIAHLYVVRANGRLVVYLLDVSEQKQLELQLAQSQKMQAIGQLAGGVAHDFNNLLTAIQLRLDELLHRHPVGDPSYEGLNEIRQTSLRAADLVRKLLAFSRKQTVQRETLELGELISEFEVLLRRLLREDVKLVTDYGRDLPQVRADKSQLETAVMNLAVNARDALRSHGSGDGGPPVVRIRTARLTQMEARQLGYPDPAPIGCALIEVADNGPGIPPEVMAKIFEPFFTTKPIGEGTGLGLATVYGIVKQADGWIHVDSEPGKGAAFRIFLPIHVPAAGEAVRPNPLKFKPAPRDLSGAGRILFVEDEDAVRGVAARLLRARGYEVIEASDGEEALELAKQWAGKIDLLISDVVMPEMDGPTLLKKARQYLGDARVLFISGYAEAEFSDLLEGEEGVTFLPKPLDIKVLAERVKQQLQA